MASATMSRLCFVAVLLCLSGCTPDVAAERRTTMSTIVSDELPSTHSPTSHPVRASTAEPTPLPQLPDCPDAVLMFCIESDTRCSLQLICANGSQWSSASADLRVYAYGLSPRGNLRAQTPDDGEGIVLSDSSGQEVKTLLAGSGKVIFDLSWSSDGELLAYTYGTQEVRYPFAVEIIHIETEVISPLPLPDDPNLLGIDVVRWSPTANQLLIQGGAYPVQILNATCDVQHNCTFERWGQAGKFTNQMAFAPWSPDGTRIAYACYTAWSDERGNYAYDALCVQDAATGDVIEFREDDLGVRDIEGVRWSPDGERIAFSAYPDDEESSEIFILSLDDGHLFSLTQDIPGSKSQPDWLP